MPTTRWIVVVTLALATAVVLPGTGIADEAASGDCVMLYPEPSVHPEECICWPCNEDPQPGGTDP